MFDSRGGDYRRRAGAPLCVLGNGKLRLVDVGAAVELPPHWNKARGLADFLCFEPHSESARSLREEYSRRVDGSNYLVLETGLSGLGGNRQLTKTHVPTGSTILSIDEESPGFSYVSKDYFYPAEFHEIPTQTLSHALDQVNWDRIDGIKLDIQGAELEVLRGLGESRWDHLLVVESEIGMVRCYREQPVWSEFDSELRSRGFELMDLRAARTYPTWEGNKSFYHERILGVRPEALGVAGRLWEIDAIYMKSPSGLLSARDGTGLRKLIVLYGIYCLFPEGLHLAERARAAGIFSEKELGDIKENLKAWYHSSFIKPLDKKGVFNDLLLKVLGRLKLGPNKVWARHMWVDYPNS